MSWNVRDWYSSTNPDELLRLARPLEKVTTKFDPARERRRQIYDRRLRLFGCACVRTVWDFLPVDARNAVVLSERFAEGRATRAELQAAKLRILPTQVTFLEHALCAAGMATEEAFATRFVNEDVSCWEPAFAARSAAKALATRAAGPAPPGNPTTKEWEAVWNEAYATARAHQTEFVRDIFPPIDNVIRALRFERDWRTSTVVALARGMDETSDFSAVPILADALQDAGCDNELILDRCRAPSGIHCRGNWVVDLVLGRE